MKEQQEVIYYAMYSKEANQAIHTKLNELQTEGRFDIPDVNDYIWFIVNFNEEIHDYPEIMDTTVRERIHMELKRRHKVEHNMDISSDAIYMLGYKYYLSMINDTQYKATYAMEAISDDRGDYRLTGGIKNDPNGLQFELYLDTSDNLELLLVTYIGDIVKNASEWVETRSMAAQTIGELIFLTRSILKKYPTLESMLKVAYRNNGDLC